MFYYYIYVVESQPLLNQIQHRTSDSLGSDVAWLTVLRTGITISLLQYQEVSVSRNFSIDKYRHSWEKF